MIALLKKSKFIFHTVWLIRRLVGITPEKKNLQFHLKNQKRLFNTYFQSNKVFKLQIGAQSNSINDWLNVDLEPKSHQVALMDATKPFPFADETFDFVFSEHMIEHINFEQGKFMLQECFRVLKKGGKIRIVTPNLKFLIDLYQEPKNKIQQAYIHFSQKYFQNQIPEIDTVVINNFFRDWGHQFIHDEKSLNYLLEKSGFQQISLAKVNESKYPEFQNIEQHHKEIGEEFNILESILIEAEK
jgi:predicted SAM-dependent methyltransferase